MDKFMEAALAEAKKGMETGGIPIGSVIVHNGEIIGRGHNQRVQQGSATLHGEMDALENAGRQPASVYKNSVLYTTLSPCPMCTGAILLYGIPKVVISFDIAVISIIAAFKPARMPAGVDTAENIGVRIVTDHQNSLGWD